MLFAIFCFALEVIERDWRLAFFLAARSAAAAVFGSAATGAGAAGGAAAAGAGAGDSACYDV